MSTSHRHLTLTDASVVYHSAAARPTLTGPIATSTFRTTRACKSRSSFSHIISNSSYNSSNSYYSSSFSSRSPRSRPTTLVTSSSSSSSFSREPSRRRPRSISRRHRHICCPSVGRIPSEDRSDRTESRIRITRRWDPMGCDRTIPHSGTKTMARDGAPRGNRRVHQEVRFVEV